MLSLTKARRGRVISGRRKQTASTLSLSIKKVAADWNRGSQSKERHNDFSEHKARSGIMFSPSIKQGAAECALSKSKQRERNFSDKVRSDILTD